MWKECFQFHSAKCHRFSLGPPVSCCSNTGPIRVGPYWISREYSLKLIELSSINIGSLVQFMKTLILCNSNDSTSVSSRWCMGFYKDSSSALEQYSNQYLSHQIDLMTTTRKGTACSQVVGNLMTDAFVMVVMVFASYNCK